MKLAIILSVAVAGLGYCSQSKAECYVRTNIQLTRQNIIAGPTDVQRLVVPDPAGSKCVSRYRVYIKDQWHTAEGTATGHNEAEACTRAMDIGRGHALAEVEPDKVSASMTMVCSDLPDIRIRTVHIGETVWESETDMHVHPQERDYFWYKRSKCRYFTEQSARDNNMITYQGVICKKDSTPGSKWQVIDKY